MEVALFVVQLGGRPPSAKPWKGLGSGVFEIVDAAMMSKTRKAAKLVGMPQSKISQIRNYRLQNISLERLMHVLVALDQHVEIVVTPALSVGSS